MILLLQLRDGFHRAEALFIHVNPIFYLAGSQRSGHRRGAFNATPGAPSFVDAASVCELHSSDRRARRTGDDAGPASHSFVVEAVAQVLQREREPP